MKSKFSLVIIVTILLVIGILIYFFVIKSDGTSNQESGLVSTNTGAAGAPTSVSTGAAQTGSQVVQILRNLSIIKLDDAVFRNPAFAYLSDISIALPPPANQGRRNPFGAVGTDVSTSSGTTATGSSTTPIAPTTGGGF